MPNILICNSSKEKSYDIASKVQDYCGDQVKSVICFDKGEALLSYLEENNPESSILFIDLGFCKDGLRIAELSLRVNPWTVILFSADNGKWDLNVYKIDHAYGLEYPFSKEKLRIAIDKAIEKIDKVKSTLIPIKEKGIINPVNLKEIHYLEQYRRVIYINTEKQYRVYAKFSEINNYQADFFVRCHNSFVVNFLYVRGMEECYFLMKDGKKIPISRSRRNQAREEYEAFITRGPLRAIL